MENGWAELPEELLTKVLVQAVEQCTPQDGGWGTGAGGACRCKASATVRLVCSGWKCRHDALVMRLVLRQDATDKREGWCGAAVARWTSSATALTR
jgi:hypothetical protein